MVFHEITPEVISKSVLEVRTGRVECHHLYPAFSSQPFALQMLFAPEPIDGLERDNHRISPLYGSPESFYGNNQRRVQPRYFIRTPYTRGVSQPDPA